MKVFLYKIFLATAITILLVFSIPFIQLAKTGNLKREKQYIVREVSVKSATKKKKTIKKKIIKKRIVIRKSRSLSKGSGRFALDLAVQGSGDGSAFADNASSTGSFKSWEVDTPPISSMEIPAKFPEEAEKKRIEGVVELEFVISESGFTESIRVVREKPNDYGFGVAAVDAVKRWRFRPAQKAGIPVRIEVKRVIEFRY